MHIEHAAQRERDLSAALCGRDRFSLRRSNLQCGVRPGDDALAVFLLHILANRQNANVGEDRIGLASIIPAGGLDEIDAVVGKNEAAGGRAAAGIDIDCERARAGRDERRQKRSSVEELFFARRYLTRVPVASAEELFLHATNVGTLEGY